MNNFQALAQTFHEKVMSEGFTYSISESGAIISINKSFPKGDMDEFIKCDAVAPYLLSLIPAGLGSIWGTDGGSVGGHIAVKNGNFCLNKSGVKKMFVKELRKLK